MFSRLLFVVCGFLAVASCSQEDGTPVATTDDCLNISSTLNGQEITGEYIVEPASDQRGRAVSLTSILADYSIANIDRPSTENRYSRARLSKQQVEILRRDSRIKMIEPDRVIVACGCFSVVDTKTITWNVEKVGYGNGEGKTAWIIDSGIDGAHPDLNVSKSLSKSFIDGDALKDNNGHGTHVAGIIGALNNTIGTLGVASGATLVSLQVLGENGEGKLSNMLYALDYIGSHGKAGDVVNISIAFESTSNMLEQAIQRLANQGIYFALAAGNEASEANQFSPARTSGKNIYTVSAVDSLNRMAAFSNFGNDVIDFAAPGVEVLSTFPDGKYAVLSGTSQAAPHVAGLLLVGNGNLNSSGAATSDPDGVGDLLVHE